jgi:hypothetical protein
MRLGSIDILPSLDGPACLGRRANRTKVLVHDGIDLLQGGRLHNCGSC